jgi:hypothetical protein
MGKLTGTDLQRQSQDFGCDLVAEDLSYEDIKTIPKVDNYIKVIYL